MRAVPRMSWEKGEWGAVWYGVVWCDVMLLLCEEPPLTAKAQRVETCVRWLWCLDAMPCGAGAPQATSAQQPGTGTYGNCKSESTAMSKSTCRSRDPR
jgi:hypothetical protein